MKLILKFLTKYNDFLEDDLGMETPLGKAFASLMFLAVSIPIVGIGLVLLSFKEVDMILLSVGGLVYGLVRLFRKLEAQ